MNKKIDFKEKVKAMAKKHGFSFKGEREEEDDGILIHILTFENQEEKRVIEITFDKIFIAQIDYKAFLSHDCYIQIIFYPNFPSIEFFINHQDNCINIISVDIKFNIERILEILFREDFPEFWVWANNRSSNLTIK